MKVAKIVDIRDFNHAVLMNMKKDPLTKCVDKLRSSNIKLYKSVAWKIYQLSQKVVTTKPNSFPCKDKLDAVQDTVNTEFNHGAIAYIVRKYCVKPHTPSFKSEKQFVKSLSMKTIKAGVLLSLGQRRKKMSTLLIQYLTYYWHKTKKISTKCLVRPDLVFSKQTLRTLDVSK